MIVVVVALVFAGVLGGCATFSGNGGFGAVEQVAKERLNKDVTWQRDDRARGSVRSTVKTLLASPLSVDNAVQVALLNNPGLQATYAELGIAEADLVQAGRMTNPHFAYLRTSEGGERKLEWALTFPIIDLLTIPLRTRIESDRFEQVKLAVAGRVLDVATMTRNSWIEAVAAEERVRYLEQVELAAEASAELASRMERAGNFNRLERMREAVFHLELGPAATKEDPEPWKRGFEVSLQLPIFDWGSARVARAEAIYMQALHRVAETAVNAGSEVRIAYSAYHTAYDTAMRYRDEIVPLRKKIAEENMLRYNGMLISVFELLADAREQVGAVNAYIEALRDFWLSESDLQAAFNGPPTGRHATAQGASGGMAPTPAPAGH